VATLIVLLSLSGEQRARYFLPLWPVFAVLVAEFCVRGAERARGLVEWTVALYLVLMMATGALLIWGTAPVADAVFFPAAAWERWTMAGAIVAGATAALLSLRVDQSGLAASVGLAAGLGIALFVTALEYPPRFARVNDFPGIAWRVASRLDPAHPLLAYPDANLAWDFYLRSPVRELRSESEAKAVLAASPTRQVLMRAEDWQRLKPQADAGWRALDEGQIGRRHFVLLGR